MPAKRALFVVSAALCLSMAGGGCQKHGGKDEEAASADGGEGSGRDDASAPARDDRIPVMTGEPVGVQPGYVEGAMLYASVRASSVQTLFQSLPMPPREAEEFAELGQVLGADPRVDDVIAHLGIAPDAFVSLSVRPVVTWAAEVREAIVKDAPELRELARVSKSTSAGDGHTQVIARPDEAEGAPVELPPSELSPAARALERKARSLGLHVRVHLPVATPGKMDHLIGLLAADMRSERWAATCAALGPTRVCGGHSDGVIVLRDVPGGLQVDVLSTFEGDYEEPDDEFRRAAIQQALVAPMASASCVAAGLRGDAVLLIDGPGAVTAMRAAALARVIDHLSLDEGDWLRERIRGREDALRQLHETERMFEGVSVEASLTGETLLAVANWLPTDSGRARAEAVFERAEIDADVPSLAALCDGALVCGRSRGLPNRQAFAPLATGIYGDPEALGELLDRHEEVAAAVLVLETWPNAIGATAGLPGQILQGPQAYMIQNVIDMSERVLGAGFSIRSLSQSRHVTTGDWVGYARTTATDLNALRGFLQMADVRLAPAAIPDVPGRVEFAAIPDGDVPGNAYAIYDPPAASGEWGWAVLADGDDRVRWLAGLAHDDGAVPIVYGEIGDLWRLVASFSEGREEFAFAQSWLSGRWVRGQLGIGPRGAPQLRWAMGKLD